MTTNQYKKDPSAILDWAFDWMTRAEPWLATGESISSYTITADTGSQSKRTARQAAL